MNIFQRVARLKVRAERMEPAWKFFFHPMSDARNDKQAWTAVRVKSTAGQERFYLKEEFYGGEEAGGLRRLIAQVRAWDSRDGEREKQPA